MKIAVVSALFALWIAASADASSVSWRERVSSVLARSTFAGEAVPMLDPDLGMQYQPMVLTMVASLKSREPARSGRWEEFEMPPVGVAESCEGPITAHVRRSNSGSALTFVILPGSHASFQHGGFTNQVSAALLATWGDPNIVALDGFQSPRFLSGRCRSVIWNMPALGRDLRSRLFTLGSKLGFNGSNTGLIGFSGGATLAIFALANDTPSEVAFGLGAMAFSPILDGRSSFRLLDTSHQASSVEPSEGLLTWTWRTGTRSAWHLLLRGWRAFAEIYERRPREFLDRAYNEMTVGFLRKAAVAVGISEDALGDQLSYYSVYVKLGFQRSRNLPDVGLDSAFDKATDMRPALARVGAPLLVYFSADDPILSSGNGPHQPPEINSVLQAARRNPNVLVFNPRFGGHTGALLDANFTQLLAEFFSR